MAEDRNLRAQNSGSGDTGSRDAPPLLASWLMEILVCPVDRTALRQDSHVLVCQRCGRRYPVRDGIPVMIPDDVETEHTF